MCAWLNNKTITKIYLNLPKEKTLHLGVSQIISQFRKTWLTKLPSHVHQNTVSRNVLIVTEFKVNQ